MSVAMIVPAPSARASATWSSPEMPLPMTSTESPGPTRARRWARTTQPSGSAKVPSSNDTSSGSRSTPRSVCSAGTRTYSAKPPGSKFVVCSVAQAVWCPPRQAGQVLQGTWWVTATRSPTRQAVTPAPTSATVPATSWPRTSGAFLIRYHSSTSEPQTPEALMRTRISPGPTTGRGRSSTRRSLLL